MYCGMGLHGCVPVWPTCDLSLRIKDVREWLAGSSHPDLKRVAYDHLYEGPFHRPLMSTDSIAARA